MIDLSGQHSFERFSHALHASMVDIVFQVDVAIVLKDAVSRHRTYPRFAFYPTFLLNFGNFVDNRIDFSGKTL